MTIRRLVLPSLVALAVAGTARGTVIPYTGAIVTYVVPATGTYDITAVSGAGGASVDFPFTIPVKFALGGPGASLEDTFALIAGEQLSILVGGAAAYGPARGGGGGGGGTFVVAPGNTPLLIAGGGGGGDYGLNDPYYPSSPGSPSPGVFSTGGGGGFGDYVNNDGGGGGGGLFSDGGTATGGDLGGDGHGGSAFVNGGYVGVAGRYGGGGGLGGGGGGGTDGDGGGGGGYSGGSSGLLAGGGGGTSYDESSNPIFLASANAYGSGSVIVTFLPEPGTLAIMAGLVLASSVRRRPAPLRAACVASTNGPR